jgi:hypothetical protein
MQPRAGQADHAVERAQQMIGRDVPLDGCGFKVLIQSSSRWRATR